jgi:hypothetical protein
MLYPSSHSHRDTPKAGRLSPAQRSQPGLQESSRKRGRHIQAQLHCGLSSPGVHSPFSPSLLLGSGARWGVLKEIEVRGKEGWEDVICTSASTNGPISIHLQGQRLNHVRYIQRLKASQNLEAASDPGTLPAQQVAQKGSGSHSHHTKCHKWGS